MTERQRRMLIASADRNGVPRRLLIALARQESGVNQKARSPMGAIGVMQLMPGTARGLGVDPYDERQNIEGGARYLAQQFKTFKKWNLALAAYNAGPGAVQQYGGIPPYRETENYVRRIMGMVASTGGMDGPRARTPRRTVTQRVQTTAGPRQVTKVVGGTLRPEAFESINAIYKMIGVPELSERMLQQTETVTVPGQPRSTIRSSRPGAAATVPNTGPGWLPKSNLQLMLRAITKAQQLGLRVGENPYVDRVDPVHTTGSHHYQTLGRYQGKKVGRAIDVSGNAKAMAAYFHWAERFAGKGLNDLFYDPAGYSYDRGRRWDKTIGGHGTHVHLSI